jgi:hypothetical protein
MLWNWLLVVNRFMSRKLDSMCIEVMHWVTGFSIDIDFKVVLCFLCKESLPTLIKFFVKGFLGVHTFSSFHICGWILQWNFFLWLPPVKSYLVNSGLWLLYTATCINIKKTAFSHIVFLCVLCDCHSNQWLFLRTLLTVWSWDFSGKKLCDCETEAEVLNVIQMHITLQRVLT